MSQRTLPFVKAQSLGNDFVLIETSSDDPQLSLQQMTHLADRRRGIGCDQLIFFYQLAPNRIKVSFYNQDGSYAKACGNGSRALANYLFEQAYNLSDLILLTDGGELSAEYDRKNHSVALAFPLPKIIKRDDLTALPQIENQVSPYSFITVGNPHLVCFLSTLNHLDIGKAAPPLATNSIFDSKDTHDNGGVNVSFACHNGDKTIQLKVWERGAGFTGACGTAACAVAMDAFQNCVAPDKEITIKQVGGDLIIRHLGNNLQVIGGAETVFRGEIQS